MNSWEKWPLGALIVCIMLMFVVQLCSRREVSDDRRNEIAQIVENRETAELINDFYMASEGDTEAIARIFNVTPSTIERIRNRTTEPSYELEDRIKEAALFFYTHNKNFYKLRSDFDPKWNLFHAIGTARDNNPMFFWLITIAVILATLYFNFQNGWQNVKVTIPLLVVIIAIYAGSIFYTRHFPKSVEDTYTVSINPAVEHFS